MIAVGAAEWHQLGVSLHLVAGRARVAVPVLPWQRCWRTSEAAVLQVLQPYQALRSGGVGP